ncbi:hypothetical protein [Synechococcus sp. M16CYN]
MAVQPHPTQTLLLTEGRAAVDTDLVAIATQVRFFWARLGVTESGLGP